MGGGVVVVLGGGGGKASEYLDGEGGLGDGLGWGGVRKKGGGPQW